MNSKYHLVGTYNETPIYYSRTKGLWLGSRGDEIKIEYEPKGSQKEMLIDYLGGMKSIETIIHKYEKDEAREAKKNV